MLQDSSSGSSGNSTTTAKPKKKLTAKQLKAKRDYAREYYRRTHGVKAIAIRRAQDRLNKREDRGVEVKVLARRLARMVDERVREEGLNPLLIAAFTLADRILSE